MCCSSQERMIVIKASCIKPRCRNYSLNYTCNKNYHALTIRMSEQPLNKKDDLQPDVGDAADDTEVIIDEIGDTAQAEPRELANKKKDTNNVNIHTELDMENSN